MAASADVWASLNSLATLTEFDAFRAKMRSYHQDARDFRSKLDAVLKAAEDDKHKRDCAAHSIQQLVRWRLRASQTVQLPEPEVEASPVSAAHTADVNKKKAEALRKWLFDPANGGLGRFTEYALCYMFNQLGVLNPGLQIELFEECQRQGLGLTQRLKARESYGVGLTKIGRVKEGIEVMSAVVNADPFSPGRGYTSNYLFDAWYRLYEVSQNVITSADADLTVDIAIWDEFDTATGPPACMPPLSSTSERVRLGRADIAKTEAVASNALTSAMAECIKGYCTEPQFEGLLRLMWIRLMLSRKKGEQLHKVPHVVIEVCRLLLLLEGGSEGKDFWMHAGHLELLCFSRVDAAMRSNQGPPDSASTDQLAFEAAVWKVLECTLGVGQLQTTHTRVSRILSLARDSSVGDEWLAPMGFAQNALKSAMKLVKSWGMQRFQAALGDGTVAQRLSFSGAQDQAGPMPSYESEFLSRTWSFRGLVGSPRPMLLPGGLTLMGARVPDLIVTRKDEIVFRHMLSSYGVLDVEEPNEAVPLIIDITRRCFFTEKLQDLHSEEHQKFDAASDAFIELLGIDANKRRKADSTCNVGAMMALFGDCREHAVVFCALYSFWVRRQVMSKISLALPGKLLFNFAADVSLPKKSPETNQQDFNPPDRKKSLIHADSVCKTNQDLEVIRELLQEEVRGAHVGVYAPIQMESKYVEAGRPDPCPESWRPAQRNYTLEDLRGGAKLSKYELSNSFLLLYRGECVSKWEERSQETGWQLPNIDGSLQVPDDVLKDVDHIELFQLVEEHTMCFRLSHRVDGLEVSRCDSFYNEQYHASSRHLQSPYTFGSGQCNLADLELVGTLDGGYMEALSEGKIVKVPVRLRLLPYSKRTESPGWGEMGDCLSYMGVEMGTSFDPAVQLTCEQVCMSVGIQSPREAFLDRLRAWYRREEPRSRSKHFP